MGAGSGTFDRRRVAWPWLATFLASAMLLATSAHADGRHGPGGGGGGHDAGRWSAPRQGERYRTLPPRTQTVIVDRSRYFYGSGAFYRPWRGGGYVVVGAPLGARVRHLPYGYVSFTLASGLYFFGAGNYYRWDPLDREYIVVERPREAAAVEREAVAKPEASTQVYAYPKNGQGEQQADRDRYDCHNWAVEQSGFDPAEPGDRTDLIPDYRRAMTACLEGRGYSVQ